MSKGKKFTHIYGIFTGFVCIFCFVTFKRALTKGKAGGIVEFLCFMSVYICFSYRRQS